jgi:hypothetical protein
MKKMSEKETLRMLLQAKPILLQKQSTKKKKK